MPKDISEALATLKKAIGKQKCRCHKGFSGACLSCWYKNGLDGLSDYFKEVYRKK